MRKIFIFLVTVVVMIIAGCDDSSPQNSPDYKQGYSAGYTAGLEEGSDQGKQDVCQACNDNADTDDKQDLCSDICNN